MGQAPVNRGPEERITTADPWPEPAGPKPRGGTTPFTTADPWSEPADPLHRVLILDYAGTTYFRYRLLAGATWLPLGREVAAGALPAITLPVSFVAVPRGPLLLLRFWRDVVTARRSGHRPEYLVAVDDRVIDPGYEAVLGGTGTISYTRGSSPDEDSGGRSGDRSGGSVPRTVLTYRLSPEGAR